MGREVTLLLVEDDQIDVMAVKRAFKERKIANRLEIAGDGVEALEILRGSDERPALPSPYIIILDLNMPRMNGFQFLDEVRADPDLRQAVIFVMTTSKDDTDRAKAYSQNIAGYITKSEFDTSYVDAVSMLEAYSKVVVLP